MDINKPRVLTAFLSCTVYYQENAGHHSRIRNSLCSGIKKLNF